MRRPSIVRAEATRALSTACWQLVDRARARAVVLIDRNGHELVTCGDVSGLDITSIASLAAGQIAATCGLARLIGERDFPTVHHEGERESLHLSLVSDRGILIVLFDERSTLGLVRLRARQACGEIAAILTSPESQHQEERRHVWEFTDADIERLFCA